MCSGLRPASSMRASKICAASGVASGLRTMIVMTILERRQKETRRVAGLSGRWWNGLVRDCSAIARRTRRWTRCATSFCRGFCWRRWCPWSSSVSLGCNDRDRQPLAVEKGGDFGEVHIMVDERLADAAGEDEGDLAAAGLLVVRHMLRE